MNDPIDNQCYDRLGNKLNDGDIYRVVKGREKGHIGPWSTRGFHSDQDVYIDIDYESEKLSVEEAALWILENR